MDNNLKIIICTTFREFNESENDKIQYLFIDGLKRQSYQNYNLVVTTFGEKKVRDILVKELGEKVFVYEDDKLPQKYRFSLTKVFENGVSEALKYKKSVVVWCTCDIILDNNFLQTIVDMYTPDLTGITHPNIISDTVDDYKNKKEKIGPLNKGIDILFFSNEIFKCQDALNYIHNYRFYNWGAFEYFLVGIALKTSKNRINIYNQSKVHKIENDRVASNETEEYFTFCKNLNVPILKKFMKDNDINHNLLEGYISRQQFKLKPFDMRFAIYSLQFKIFRWFPYCIKKCIKVAGGQLKRVLIK